LRLGQNHPGVLLLGQKQEVGGGIGPLQSERPLELVEASPLAAAVRYETHDIQYDAHHHHHRGGWKSLDLAQSLAFQVCQQGGFRRCRPGNPYCYFRYHLQMVDLSALRYLDQLSLEQCVFLEELRLPTCLIELNASHCTRLRRIHISTVGLDGSTESSKLTRINLENCYSLIPSLKCNQELFGAVTSVIFRHVRRLNLAGTKSIPLEFMEWAMGETQHLQCLSLSGVANDEIIQALATSRSAREGTLQKGTAGLCPTVTDHAIQALVQQAWNCWT
jgi:hypothetical protein